MEGICRTCRLKYVTGQNVVKVAAYTFRVKQRKGTLALLRREKPCIP